ncbi:MAG: GntR family transcriptional regulator [Clostridia bacterium]|nr:GntR family transcriptional regulator [Clostridia bacterium]
MKKLNPIRKDTCKPLYIQVAESITQFIQDNRLKAGDPLPSQNGFISRFDVSEVTIRQALQRLKTEGTITRVQGKGTFVAEPAIREQIAGVRSLEEKLSEQGIIVQNKYVESMETFPADRIRRDLKLLSGVKTFKIRRLKIANDALLALESRHFPMEVASKFSFEDLKTIPFVSLLEKYEDTRVERIEFLTRADIALELEAEIMNIPLDTPLLVTFGIYYNSAEKPVMAGRISYLADKIELGYQVYRTAAHPVKFITHI